MPLLAEAEYRRLLNEEMERIATVSDSHLHLEIPHIEGWTVASVVGHIGWVIRYVTASLRAQPDQLPRRGDVADPPVGTDLVAWFRDGARELANAFDETPADTIVPTFTGPEPSRWWLRRLSHEMAIHRWDIQSAIGTATDIDPEQAADGIDEILEVFVPHRLSFETLAGTGEVMHLHATDLDHGEWLITLHPDRLDWTRGHAKGDVAARGPVSDLLLMMWSRTPPSRLALFGDPTILDRWQRAAAF